MRDRARPLLLVALLSMALASCDETRVRRGATEFATFEEAAIRVLLSADGISQLVEVTNPEGFPLRGPPQTLRDDVSVSVTVGPTEQDLPVTARMAETKPGLLSLTTRFDGATIFVPVRIESDAGTRICRWRVSANRIETTASLELVEGPEGTMFDVVETPSVEVDSHVVAPVAQCDVSEILDGDIETALVDYVSDAIAASSAESLPASPVEVFGLLDGNLQFSHLSGFENRSGVLVVEGTTPDRAGTLEIGSDGLSIVLDATADAQRAPCAPPIPVLPLESGGARPLDPSVIERFAADFGIAVSSTWLSRVAQAGTLAGYACRGLENPRGTDPQTVDVQDLLLEELNLDAVPIGPEAALVLAPGSLPEIRLRPGNGTVEIEWSDLQVEVYGDVFGARTRLARMVADTTFGLRPRPGGVGVARFDIESLEVSTQSVDSEFVAREPTTESVDRWIQRTLLLMFDEQFDFPLPIDPATPVRVVSMQVRANDVVAFIRFE